MSRLRVGAATLAAVAVLLAGCTSDNTKTLTGPTETTANAPRTTPTIAAASPVTTTANADTNTTIAAASPVTTTANGDTSTTIVADNSAATTAQVATPPGDATVGLGGKCKELFASYLAKVGQLGSSPNAYKDLVPLLTELLSGAPADVQAAAKPTLDAFGKLAALIDKYNGDIAKASQDPDFAAVEQAMGSNGDDKASSNKVDDWLKSTCGG
jgi:ABC-type Fe3+-hydroxamate transport system substrate-binding protein